jgi:hypothetical protein
MACWLGIAHHLTATVSSGEMSARLFRSPLWALNGSSRRLLHGCCHEPWRDLQSSMDIVERSGVGLSATGLDNSSGHPALPVPLIVEDMVHEKRLAQRNALS